MFVSRFRNSPPPHRIPQEDTLRWLARAHARSAPPDLSEARLAKLLSRYGCSPDRVATRGSFLRDFSETADDQMHIFGAPGEASVDARVAFFSEALRTPVEALYPEGEPDFHHLIHVTCTGYVSPSLVQSLVSKRGWGGRVECLHAYHMGCYASLPALRMARGNLDADILHTELCTLHFDPSDHSPEQLVIQSLFADGVIRYRCSQELKGEPGFAVTGLREVIAPSSLAHMTWAVAKGGFKMSLSREVPRAVEGAVRDLIAPWSGDGGDVVYAIHPGGPRIIDAVKDALGLSEEQVWFSREVLKRHGNMSSATLPHVWQMMLPELAVGTRVISMAFGPGLTLSASEMRRV